MSFEKIFALFAAPNSGFLRCNAFLYVTALLLWPLDCGKPDLVRWGWVAQAANNPLAPKSQTGPCIRGNTQPTIVAL